MAAAALVLPNVVGYVMETSPDLSHRPTRETQPGCDQGVFENHGEVGCEGS